MSEDIGQVIEVVPAPAAPEPSPRDAFISMLPEEFRSEGVFAPFNNVGDLAKSYINAAKMVGLDKGQVVPIPRDDSKEAWDAVYNKLGRPESADKYALDAYKESATPEVLKPWADKMHSLGLNQKQVDGILGEFFGQTKAGTEAQKAQMDAKFQEWDSVVSKEFGLAKERKLDAAVNLIEKTMGDGSLEFIAENPQVFRDPRMVKFLVNLADKTGESSVLPGGQRSDGPISPSDAKQQLNSLYLDPNYQKAIWDKAHPQHQYYVDMQSKLWEYAAPGDK